MCFVVVLSVCDMFLLKIRLWLDVCKDNIKRYDVYVKTERRKEV